MGDELVIQTIISQQKKPPVASFTDMVYFNPSMDK